MEDLFCKEKITYNWKGFKINWFFFYGFQKEIYIQLVGCAYTAAPLFQDICHPCYVI
jgi:hypothetical protein